MTKEELRNKVAMIKSKQEEKDTRLAELQERLSAIQTRLEGIKSNLGYKLLPSWIREKIEEIFGGDNA